MPALINNYCTEPRSNPPYTYNIPVTEKVDSQTSTVIAWPHSYSPNLHINKLLDEFSMLQNDWDEEGALAPGIDVLEKARSLVYILKNHGLRIFHAAPGPNGEIMIDIRNQEKRKSVEIIFYYNRSVAVKFPESGYPEQQEFNYDLLPELLGWINQ